MECTVCAIGSMPPTTSLADQSLSFALERPLGMIVCHICRKVWLFYRAQECNLTPQGIIYQLAKANGGLGVILEHRYYGESFPVPDLSTENLRFLTTDQSLADTTYFANNIVFPGLENENLTAKDAPYIAYGGSYAGAYVSFLRKLYPETWFGAISSSGVTNAQWDYWQYYAPIAQYGPQSCINLTQTLTNVMDNVIFNNRSYLAELKQLFNLQDVQDDADFTSATSSSLGGWQSRNWDPVVNSRSFDRYCGNISSDTLVHPSSQGYEAVAEELIAAGGYADQAAALAPHLLNWAGYVNFSTVQSVVRSGENISEYFSTQNSSFYAQDDITQTWRAWPYQYCTQWGYLQVGSTVPEDQLPLISRTITLEYASTICRDAFNLMEPAKTEEINQYGGFTISYPRLAQLGGQTDPWRPTTPVADPYLNTPSTTSEPRILIEGAVHHWDENGLFPNETTATLPPAPVKDAQSQEAAFVQEWLSEWQARRR